MAQQALETFVAEIDGAPVVVTKGEVFADKHPVVALDAGRGLLFRPLDVEAKTAPAKAPRAAKGSS
jgi:hypothetical protein